jgi:polyphosphate kinase
MLALGEDPRQPLLERVKYLAIVASNLDEFFQVRVAGLRAQVDAGVTTPSSDGRTPRQQLLEIRARVEAQHQAADALLHKELLPALAEQRIRLVDWASLQDSDRARPRGSSTSRCCRCSRPSRSTATRSRTSRTCR